MNMKKLSIILLLTFLNVSMMAQTPGTLMSTKKISALSGNIPANVLQTGDQFGCSIDTIGDLNGDGVMDIVVGAFGDDDGNSGTGAAYILFMDSNRTVNSYQKISATQGNFIGNNLQAGEGFGYRVASIGDINNDGIMDIAVGSPFSDVGGTDRGSVYVIFLNTNGTVKGHQKINNSNGYLSGGIPLQNSGWFASVSAIGDINNDGIPDIAVGCSQDSGGPSSYQKGAIYVLLMDTTGKASSYYKIQNGVTNFTNLMLNGDRLGISVSSIGDINRDGIPDIASGAFRDDTGGNNSGAVYVIFLDTNGSVKSYSKISNSSFTSNVLSGEFGVSVSGVHDVDGNGVDNLLIGAYSQSNYAGAAYLINIDTTGTVVDYKKYEGTAIPTNTSNERFGWGASRFADINKDGYLEVCVGAARDNDGGSMTGAVYVLSLKVNLSVNIFPKNPLCHNGSDGMAVAVASGLNPPFTYLWSNGSTNDTITGLSQGNYSVTITNSTNATKTASVTIGQPPILNLVTSSNTSVCTGDTTIISAAISGGSGNKTFHWNQGLSDTTSHFVNPITNTTYTVYATDTNNCSSDTNSIIVAVNPLPMVTFSGLYYNYCDNDPPSTLSGSPSGGVFSGGGIQGNLFYPNIGVSFPSPHTVTYSYTDGNGCTGFNTDTILIHISPIIQIIGIDSTYCTNDSDILFASLPCSNCTYTINGNYSSNFSPSTLGAGSYSIIASTVDIGTGCVATDTLISNVYTSPIATLSGLNSTYCSNGEIDTLVGLPTGGVYIGSGANGPYFNPANAMLGTDSVQYIYNTTHCSDTASMLTNIIAAPIAEAGNNALIPCFSNGSSIGETPDANHTYIWSPYAGLNNPFIANPTANPWIDSTVFVVTKTNIYSQCSSKDSVLITIAQNPSVAITGDTVICYGDSVHLMASGANSYIWKYGIIGDKFDKHIPITQYISVIGTDTNNCIDKDSVVVLVNPLPQPNLGNDTAIYMDSITLNPGNYVSYQWNTGATTSNIVVNSNLTPGNYSYTVSVKDQNGCSSSDTIVISITTDLSYTNQEYDIKVYPNPTKGLLNLEWPREAELQTVDVYDAFGRLIQSIAIDANSIQTQINLKELAKGSYFIRLKGNEFTKVVTVVVE